MDILSLLKLKSKITNERKLLDMLNDTAFSIPSFTKEANKLTTASCLYRPELAPFILKDNTLDVEAFKTYAKNAINKEIKRYAEVIQSTLQPISDVQALLEDKEIQQLLKE
jgi:hypothetical protein